MAIMVKCVRMPGAVTEVAVEDGADVAAALDAANIIVGSTESITVNGSTAASDQVLSDGDRIIIAKEAKSA
jgi:hypothetical protein